MALINIVQRLDDVAEFIANPNPDRPFENAVGSAGRQVCDSFANAPDWANTLTGIGPVGSGTSVIKTMCQPYYNQNGFDAPTFEPSKVSGGQCPGVLYSVSVQQNRADNGAASPPFFLGNFRGPMRSATPINPPVNCTNPTIPVNNYYRFNSGAGTAIYQSNSCSAFAQNPQLICVPLEPETDCDGGDEPPRFTPGANRPADPGPLPPGVTPTLNDDGEPVFGTPEFDPGDGFPPLNIPDDPGAAPPATPVASPGGETSPGDFGSVGPSAGDTPEGGGEVMLGDPPPGRAWVGVFVRLNVPNSYGSIPKTAGNNFAFPRVIGNACLVFSGNRSTTAVRLTSEETDIFRPHSTLVVMGAIVNCLPGITATVFPVSAEICPESTCSIA